MTNQYLQISLLIIKSIVYVPTHDFNDTKLTRWKRSFNFLSIKVPKLTRKHTLDIDILVSYSKMFGFLKLVEKLLLLGNSILQLRVESTMIACDLSHFVHPRLFGAQLSKLPLYCNVSHVFKS